MDRLCSLYPAFSITSLAIHRILVAAATVAAKACLIPTIRMRRMRELATSGFRWCLFVLQRADRHEVISSSRYGLTNSWTDVSVKTILTFVVCVRGTWAVQNWFICCHINSNITSPKIPMAHARLDWPPTSLKRPQQSRNDFREHCFKKLIHLIVLTLYVPLSFDLFPAITPFVLQRVITGTSRAIKAEFSCRVTDFLFSSTTLRQTVEQMAFRLPFHGTRRGRNAYLDHLCRHRVRATSEHCLGWLHSSLWHLNTHLLPYPHLVVHPTTRDCQFWCIARNMNCLPYFQEVPA